MRILGGGGLFVAAVVLVLAGLALRSGWLDWLINAVGFLLIELMIRENRAGFGAWVRAVKQGDDWSQALRDRFGVSRSRLVGTFVQYYLVND